MIVPSDREYKLTKRIKQGKAVMNPHFKPLSDWIYKTYDVQTMNIIYDTIEQEKTPRLQIIFEFEDDRIKFNDNRHFGYDKEKQQAIARQFKMLIQNQELIEKRGLTNFLTDSGRKKYMTDNIWVIFSAFEPIAKIEANESMPQQKVNALKNEVGNKDLWEISRCFSGTTFFFYTDKQVEEYSKNGLKVTLTEKYFNLLKQYDEFDYFKKDEYTIYLDSKENFDNNYQSNWYYYYK